MYLHPLPFLVFIIYMWWSYKRFNDEYQETPEAERLESQKENVQWYFYGAIVVSIVGGVILLVLLVLRKRLALVIALFQEAGRALRRMPLLLFFPLVVCFTRKRPNGLPARGYRVHGTQLPLHLREWREKARARQRAVQAVKRKKGEQERWRKSKSRREKRIRKRKREATLERREKEPC